MYYNLNKTLSYNKLFNFVIGARGVGKTYGCKKYCITRFLKYGEQFVYIRRYRSEFKKIKTFFSDISQEFEGHEFKVEGGTFYIDNKIAGYYIALTTSLQQKSSALPNVNTIFFDEFLIDKGCLRYLNNEVENFLELYSTISRLRDVRCVFLSNAISITNPYFNYFNVEPSDQEFTVYDDILIQTIKNEEYVEAVNNTRFGKLISSTNYYKYSVENNFLRDNQDYVIANLEDLKELCLLYHNQKYYGVYNHKSELFYISEKYNPNTKIIIYKKYMPYVQNKSLEKRGNSYIFDVLIKAYYSGALFFESVKVKNEIFDVFNI